MTDLHSLLSKLKRQAGFLQEWVDKADVEASALKSEVGQIKLGLEFAITTLQRIEEQLRETTTEGVKRDTTGYGQGGSESGETRD